MKNGVKTPVKKCIIHHPGFRGGNRAFYEHGDLWLERVVKVRVDVGTVKIADTKGFD